MYVKSEGPLDCKIALVGEAPGREEVEQGRPFVGASGDLLNKLLRSASIQRSECYITNVVKERPPNNAISTFITFGRGVSTTPEFDEYERILYAELKQVKANVIVALGAVPLYALTRRCGITKWRGSILSWNEWGARKVVATMHPAAALRDPLVSYFISADLQRALVESKSPLIQLPQRNLITHPTFLDCISFLECLRVERKPVAFDIETPYFGDKRFMSCISFASSPSEAISIPLYCTQGDYWTPSQEADIMLAITGVLEDPHVLKVAHNANFDATFLHDHYGIVTAPLECTMVAIGTLYPDFPKRLAFCTSLYTQEPYYKDDRKDLMEAPNKALLSNDQRFWEYNAKDSAVTIEIWSELRKRLERQGNIPTYLRQTRIVQPLMLMQASGFRLDVESLKVATEAADLKLTELQAALNALVGYELNIDSPKQIISYFYVEKGLPPYINRKTHRPTVDRDALKRIARKGYHEASIIMEMRRIGKLQNTYYTVKTSPDGRCRTFYNPVGTVNGRLSSRSFLDGTGANHQNLPHAVRKFYLADTEKHGFFEFDLPQAENRIVAWIAPEPAMRRAFESNIDVHRQTYGLMFGIPIDEVSDKPGSSHLGDGSKSQRFWGKQFNHSLNYGLGYKAFALRYELPESDAKELVERYHRVYPGIRYRFHLWVREAVASDCYLTNCYGRIRRFMGILRKGQGEQVSSAFEAAYNFIPQSTVADKINLTLYHIYDNVPAFQLKAQIHDSIVVQFSLDTPWSLLSEACKSVLDFLCEPIPWREPFVIPAHEVKMGRTLAGEVKLKSPNNWIEPEALKEAWGVVQETVPCVVEEEEEVEGLEDEAQQELA